MLKNEKDLITLINDNKLGPKLIENYKLMKVESEKVALMSQYIRYIMYFKDVDMSKTFNVKYYTPLRYISINSLRED